ncbi:MAG: MBL fold metallo-hydrolase [Streptococcaceae bacterium]|jgi:ribonuclease BN (tRNA processing enzyme)|nr:MBL fold metallo-hydrolase [Streptococcaceae bacterium]
MKLTIIGCLGGYPHKDQGTSSYLLTSNSGYNLLIDCGSMTLVNLEHHVSPLWVDALLLSHYHQDHIADVGVFQYYRQLWPRDDPEWDGMVLKIFGHNQDEFHFNELTIDGVSTGIAYSDKEPLKAGPFDITFMKTIHPVVCYAMRIVERKTGKVFVFTGDSGYMEEFKDFAKDADIFLAGTMFFKENEKNQVHLTSHEAGIIAKKANVKKLVMTHLPPHGDLEQLLNEGKQAAGDKVEVVLAKKDDVHLMT